MSLIWRTECIYILWSQRRAIWEPVWQGPGCVGSRLLTKEGGGGSLLSSLQAICGYLPPGSHLQDYTSCQLSSLWFIFQVVTPYYERLLLRDIIILICYLKDYKVLILKRGSSKTALKWCIHDTFSNKCVYAIEQENLKKQVSLDLGSLWSLGWTRGRLLCCARLSSMLRTLNIYHFIMRKNYLKLELRTKV